MARQRSVVDSAPVHEPAAGAGLAWRGARARSVAVLVLALLLPGGAWAGWGDENWGEMLWGGSATPVPSISIEGLIALAVLLLVVPSMLLAHRRSGAKT